MIARLSRFSFLTVFALGLSLFLAGCMGSPEDDDQPETSEADVARIGVREMSVPVTPLSTVDEHFSEDEPERLAAEEGTG